MTNQEIKRARWWIQRWKAVGGGFAVSAAARGIDISLVRQPLPLDPHEAMREKTAKVLEAELVSDTDKSDIVFHLVAEMLAGASVPLKETVEAANDDEDPEPAA